MYISNPLLHCNILIFTIKFLMTIISGVAIQHYSTHIILFLSQLGVNKHIQFAHPTLNMYVLTVFSEIR